MRLRPRIEVTPVSLETIERGGYVAARNLDEERAACARRRARALNEGGTSGRPSVLGGARDRLEWRVARSAARVLLRTAVRKRVPRLTEPR
jgi:hypothetical protein